MFIEFERIRACDAQPFKGFENLLSGSARKIELSYCPEEEFVRSEGEIV